MSPDHLLIKYEKALSNQDWQSVEPLFHKDACVTFSTGTYKGIQEIKAIFENNFSVIKDEKYTISNIHWVQKNHKNAVCLYQFNWQGIINGEPCSGGGRGTSVLILDDNKWKIITEHLGPFPS